MTSQYGPETIDSDELRLGMTSTLGTFENQNPP